MALNLVLIDRNGQAGMSLYVPTGNPWLPLIFLPLKFIPSLKGLVRYMVLVVIDYKTRQVEIAGIIPQAYENRLNLLRSLIFHQSTS